MNKVDGVKKKMKETHYARELARITYQDDWIEEYLPLLRKKNITYEMIVKAFKKALEDIAENHVIDSIELRKTRFKYYLQVLVKNKKDKN